MINFRHSKRLKWSWRCWWYRWCRGMKITCKEQAERDWMALYGCQQAQVWMAGGACWAREWDMVCITVVNWVVNLWYRMSWRRHWKMDRWLEYKKWHRILVHSKIGSRCHNNIFWWGENGQESGSGDGRDDGQWVGLLVSTKKKDILTTCQGWVKLTWVYKVSPDKLRRKGGRKENTAGWEYISI